MLPLNIPFGSHWHEVVWPHALRAAANMIQGLPGLMATYKSPEGIAVGEPLMLTDTDEAVTLWVHTPYPYPTSQLDVRHKLGGELVQGPFDLVTASQRFLQEEVIVQPAVTLSGVSLADDPVPAAVRQTFRLCTKPGPVVRSAHPFGLMRLPLTSREVCLAIKTSTRVPRLGPCQPSCLLSPITGR